MAFGDRVQGFFSNLGQGGWYLGKNVGMQPGQVQAVMAKGGPAATALAFLLRSRGVPEAEIQAAANPVVIRESMSQSNLEDWARKQGYGKKQDMTPLYIGLGVLALVLVMKK